jgi:hypothetical protein
MAFLDVAIELNDLPQPTNSYELLPAGWYDATVSGAELRDTKTGGQMIAVKYTVTGPTHQGRVVWGNINIRNANPKAEEIGRQQLGEIMRATGIARVTDTDQLIGLTMGIKIAIREAQNGYEAQNEVKGWKSTQGSAAPAPAFVPPSPAPAGKQPPWAKK